MEILKKNQYCRICGQKFAAAGAATVPATACSWSAPFKWGVRFSDAEGLGQFVPNLIHN